MSRPRWAPPFGQAARLVWRPAVAYLLFTTLATIAFLIVVATYNHGSDDLRMILIGLGTGTIGVLLGMVLSVLRLHALPIVVATGLCIALAMWILGEAHPPGGEEVGIAMVFFCFGFPCGMLALQHRWELFASFWPAIGFIGGVFVILNEEGRVRQWEENKLSAWLPVPLVLLGMFLVLWLIYLASKQALRVELWQALSGAATRRIAKKETVAAIPRRNVLPLVVVAIVLFGAVAVLSPYLWRTGKGDHEGKAETEQAEQSERRMPKIDGDELIEQMTKMAKAAKDAAVKLWPLLFLLLLYRPAKRALLTRHLQAPFVPSPPSERIDNLWEYVRIAAEDAGVVIVPSDSVEQLLSRVESPGPALLLAAQIYVRTRYGFTVARGDALEMRKTAVQAARDLRKPLGRWTRAKNLWRPLS